jgi:hypothetical protein
LDWIEQVFHINPDAGSGALEVVIVALVAVVIAVVAVGGLRRAGRRDHRADD